VPGHDESGEPEGVARPDERAEVAGARRPVHDRRQQRRPDGDAPEIGLRHAEQRQQLGGLVLPAQAGDQFGRHLVADRRVRARDDVCGPRRQAHAALVDHGLERPAAGERRRDRAHALDEERPGPMALDPVGGQALQHLEGAVGRADLQRPRHFRRV
jgi:hypothetical protein